jgi:hypothetical protein
MHAAPAALVGASLAITVELSETELGTLRLL